MVVDSDGTYEEWQDGLNKQLLVEEGSASVQVKDSWRQDTKAHLDVARGPVTDEPPQELLQKLKEAAEAEEKAAAAAEAAAKAEEKAAAAAVAAAAQEAAVKAAAEKAGEAAVAADAETEEAVEEVVEEAAAPQVNGVAAPLNGEAVESPKVRDTRRGPLPDNRPTLSSAVPVPLSVALPPASVPPFSPSLPLTAVVSLL